MAGVVSVVADTIECWWINLRERPVSVLAMLEDCVSVRCYSIHMGPRFAQIQLKK